jgi:hypothetical protein
MLRKVGVKTAGAVEHYYSDRMRLWSVPEALCDLFLETVPSSPVSLDLPSEEPCRP